MFTLRVGIPVLGHVPMHVLRHVLEHMPGHMLEHVPKHVPDRHVLDRHVLGLNKKCPDFFRNAKTVFCFVFKTACAIR